MMSDEIMIPVDSECIPDGWELVRFGLAKEGEMEVWYNSNGIAHPSIRTCDPLIPRLIIRKKYDPGIPLPKGWWVWEYRELMGVWVASQIVEVLSEDYIWGIEHIPGFITPPDGQPRQIN
jgi:hypothetical protein